MQINLEIYVNDMERDPLANVICNAAPRVGEYIMLLAGESPNSGRYRVLMVEHILDERRRPPELLQHVCVVVCRERN